MSEFRLKRVNELLAQELSKEIRRALPVNRYGVISITSVEVSKDLKNANVFVSAIGGRNQTENLQFELERHRGMLQEAVSRRVKIKYTPHLSFKFDHGLERGQHLVDLLDSLDTPHSDGQKT